MGGGKSVHSASEVCWNVEERDVRPASERSEIQERATREIPGMHMTQPFCSSSAWKQRRRQSNWQPGMASGQSWTGRSWSSTKPSQTQSGKLTASISLSQNMHQ
ncbi:hypothetical protein [Candidatus Methylacidiphilum infernorum]|uniref:hypothetical protein n=1 Tax=Candidatus Methylacidiphilum infernorum TaxID=511746 RepID=UPI00164F0C27|nr:hypothetical protein [Candidatus Methylacidiphilum infernorum]